MWLLELQHQNAGGLSLGCRGVNDENHARSMSGCVQIVVVSSEALYTPEDNARRAFLQVHTKKNSAKSV